MTQPDASAPPRTCPAPGTRGPRSPRDPPATPATPADWAARATEAARSVTRGFGQRLFFLPGTHIAAISRPSGRFSNLIGPWHYWWQAHYVDCLVDTGRRELGTANQPRPGSTANTAPAPAGSPPAWSPASGCAIS